MFDAVKNHSSSLTDLALNSFSLDTADRITNTSGDLSKLSHRHATSLNRASDLEQPLTTNKHRSSQFLSSSFNSLSSSSKGSRRSPYTEVDTVTGIKKGEALTSAGRTKVSRTASTLNGRLDFSDSLNPTRSGAFKDDYLLNNATGGRVQISMNSSSFDTYLQVVNSQTGRVIAFDDDSGTGSDSQLSLTIQAGVNYVVRATSYEAYDTGSYSLTANISGGSTPAPPSSGFNTTIGYGLVDASSAVARSINTSRFADVADLGGNNWGNDMVKAPEVWARGYTGRNITVAVIDSGVDITHPDLRNNLWFNSREIANDRIDNDRNGYVDDVYGWNFGVGQNNNNVMPGTNDSGQGHGTHVAGTIASANNGFRMTGVAPNARIMALRLGNVSGGRFTNAGSLAQAVRYAVDNGARVINMSLGWTDSPELGSALAYASSKNVITVSAAGNERSASPRTPARYATQYGLSVGAVDRNRSLASFSNRAGSNSQMRHVVAPGVGVYSTLPYDQYGEQNGTSMASPHVAGVVALMLSANPNLTHTQVRQIITESAVSQGISTASINSLSRRRVSQVTLGVPSLKAIASNTNEIVVDNQTSQVRQNWRKPSF